MPSTHFLLGPVSPLVPKAPSSEMMKQLQELGKQAGTISCEPAQTMAILAFLFLYSNIIGLQRYRRITREPRKKKGVWGGGGERGEERSTE